MDGLSVIASVTGILTATAKVIMMATKFIEKERDAPHSMRKVLAEVADFNNCLTQLSPFLQNIENVPTERKAAISVEQVVAINTSCVLTLSELEKVLDSFQLDQPMAAGTRLRWARHQEKIENILVRLRASKSSLNLILTIFTCTSVSEIQSSISNLSTTVQSILANSEDIPRRIASIETKIAGLSRHATSTIERPTDTSDSTSTIHPTSHSIENGYLYSPGVGHTLSQFGVQIQKELEASRVYRRSAKRHSTSSFLSGLHSAAWSALSGVSLAEISALSVLSLPISYHELWNPQHYKTAHKLYHAADSSSTSALYPLDTQGEADLMAREGLSDTYAKLTGKSWTPATKGITPPFRGNSPSSATWGGPALTIEGINPPFRGNSPSSATRGGRGLPIEVIRDSVAKITTDRHEISAPIMTENSLGWN